MHEVQVWAGERCDRCRRFLGLCCCCDLTILECFSSSSLLYSHRVFFNRVVVSQALREEPFSHTVISLLSCVNEPEFFARFKHNNYKFRVSPVDEGFHHSILDDSALLCARESKTKPEDTAGTTGEEMGVSAPNNYTVSLIVGPLCPIPFNLRQMLESFEYNSRWMIAPETAPRPRLMQISCR